MISPPNEHASPVRILLAEDNDDHAQLMMRGFSKSDRDVDLSRAKTGADTIANLTSCDRSNLPHFVLLDINMPGISGLEVLERLRDDDRFDQLPIIILTTSRDPFDMSKAYENGANSYVVKPESLERLGDFVASCLDFWGRWNARDANLKD